MKQTQCENVRTGNDALREAKTLQVVTRTPRPAPSFRLPAELGIPACLPAVRVYASARVWCFMPTGTSLFRARPLPAYVQGLKHHSVVEYLDVFLHSADGYLVVCTVMELCNRYAPICTHWHIGAGPHGPDAKSLALSGRTSIWAPTARDRARARAAQMKPRMHRREFNLRMRARKHVAEIHSPSRVLMRAQPVRPRSREGERIATEA